MVNKQTSVCLINTRTSLEQLAQILHLSTVLARNAKKNPCKPYKSTRRSHSPGFSVQTTFETDCVRAMLIIRSASSPGDLKTRKRTGTSCQIEIYFSIKTTKFLFKYTLLCSQIYDRFIILFIKHIHKVSASFIKEKQRYK